MDSFLKSRPNDGNISTQHCFFLLLLFLFIYLFYNNATQHYWVQHVVHVWPPCCDVLQHVGCCWLKFFMQRLWMLHDVLVVLPGSCHNVAPRHAHWFDFQYPICRNTSQQVGQMCATCCAEQCCDMLYSNVAIVWPELANTRPTML